MVDMQSGRERGNPPVEHSRMQPGHLSHTFKKATLGGWELRQQVYYNREQTSSKLIVSS